MKNEKVIFAEEKFRVDIQQMLHEKMVDRGMSVKSLARKAKVSTKYVNDFFESGPSKTKKIAKLFYALGYECELVLKRNGSWTKGA